MQVFEALDQAMVVSFADMAFMDVVEESGPDDDIACGQIVHLDFSHPLSGYLTLYLSAATKRRIVENIYGYEWENLAGSKVDDCLMELVNIIAGNFLGFTGKDEHRHAVSLPQILFDDTDLPHREHRIRRFYRADDALVCAALVHQPPEHG